MKWIAAALLMIMATGCSSSTPTAPTSPALSTVAPAGDAMTATLFTSHHATCDAYSGRYRAACQQSIALQCGTPDANAEACRHSGVYVSRDPVACASILFLCPEGFMPFFDETGCGCRLGPGEMKSARGRFR